MLIYKFYLLQGFLFYIFKNKIKIFLNFIDLSLLMEYTVNNLNKKYYEIELEGNYEYFNKQTSTI
ncbi:hypothetical protein GCM10022323_25120 [Asaccharospora irregularis DSM 2635]